MATILSALAILCVWLRERGISYTNKQKEASLERQRIEMEGRLTNLPPRQFIFEYSSAIKNIGELRRLTKQEHQSGTLDQKTLHKRIRTIISSILSLTRLWDGVSQENKKVVYQANIMLLFTKSELSTDAGASPQDQEKLEKWLLQFEFFLHNQSFEIAIQRCSGILTIADNSYSASSAAPNDEPDPDLEDICLPYTNKTEYIVGHNHPNLPGAPMVAASGECEYLNSTQQVMLRWLDEQQKTNPETNQRYYKKLKDYYQELDTAKSLLSIPLFIDNDLYAILNINKNNENMLLNNDRAEQFVNLLSPICYQLSKMLQLSEENY